MDLKELLGEELFTQVDAKLNEVNSADDRKSNPVKLVDLSEGAYVGKEKYASLQTEMNGYKTQLGEANKTINSYKEMDIDGIKQSASEWEKKYKEDTENLQRTLETERKTHAAERFLDTQKIKSPLSRKTILQEFMAQNLEFKDGAFAGAEDYMKKVKEQYPDEFEKDDPQEHENKPFVRGTQNTYRPKTKSEQEAYLESKYGKNKYYSKK